jgi:hypothetical protein
LKEKTSSDRKGSTSTMTRIRKIVQKEDMVTGLEVTISNKGQEVEKKIKIIKETMNTITIEETIKTVGKEIINNKMSKGDTKDNEEDIKDKEAIKGREEVIKDKEEDTKDKETIKAMNKEDISIGTIIIMIGTVEILSIKKIKNDLFKLLFYAIKFTNEVETYQHKYEY